jgi:predicted RNase H-like HicB family nuclease
MTKQIKIVVEKNEDGYTAYPLGIEGVVVGQGDTYDEALSDVKSAIKFHVETFGTEVLNSDPEIIEAYLTETGIEI